MIDISNAALKRDIEIQVKSQVPERKFVGTINITCRKFTISFSLDKDDEVIQHVSAGFQINNKYVEFKEKEKIEINYKNTKIIIIPISVICRGFILKIKVGDNDWQMRPISLGDEVIIEVLKTIE